MTRSGRMPTEFWNRSISKVWSVDGTGPGPGHTLTPDLQDVDGTLWPDPETDYVLAANGVEVVGEVGRVQPGGERLARPARRTDPPPRRTRRASRRTAGRSAIPATRPCRRVRRTTASSPRTAAPARRDRDPLARDVLPAGRPAPGRRPRADRRPRPRAGQAAGDRPRDRLGGGVRPGLRRPDGRPADACGPWRVEVEIDTFVPAQVDPEKLGGERRALGARVAFQSSR